MLQKYFIIKIILLFNAAFVCVCVFFKGYRVVKIIKVNFFHLIIIKLILIIITGAYCISFNIIIISTYDVTNL